MEHSQRIRRKQSCICWLSKRNEQIPFVLLFLRLHCVTDRITNRLKKIRNKLDHCIPEDMPSVVYLVSCNVRVHNGEAPFTDRMDIEMFEKCKMFLNRTILLEGRIVSSIVRTNIRKLHCPHMSSYKGCSNIAGLVLSASSLIWVSIITKRTW